MGRRWYCRTCGRGAYLTTLEPPVVCLGCGELSAFRSEGEPLVDWVITPYDVKFLRRDMGIDPEVVCAGDEDGA